MTLQDLLNKTVPALVGLADQLDSIAAKYPDMESSLRPKIDVLRAVADPIRLADLATTAVNEVKHLVTTGEIIPRQHPDTLAS